MANIAQVVNVLQSMILTDGPKMILTPTYHVFRMYNVHQNATFVPTEYKAGEIVSANGRIMSDLSISTSSKDGKFHVSIANPSLDKAQKITLNFDELKPSSVSGEILKSKKITDHNEFDKAPAVAPVAFNGYKLAKGTITVEVPAASVIVLEIR